MAFFAYFKRIPPELGGKIKFTRENGILWSVYALIFLFTLLLLADGFLFYITVLSVKEDPPPVPQLVDFSEKEIDEMLEILDARQENFEKVFRAP